MKKKVEHSQTGRVKKIFEIQALFLTFGTGSIVMDIKRGFLSKHLFQKTQQHGAYTKHLGKDKFI